MHVEVLGKISTDQLVTISGSEPSVNGIDFEVNSMTVNLPTGLSPFSIGTVLHLYPNPTTDQVYIKLGIKKAIGLTVSIVDQMGRHLSQETHTLGSGEQEISLNLKDLPAGIYLIQMSAEGEVLTRKVIKK